MPLPEHQWVERTVLLAMAASLAATISVASGDSPTDGGDSVVVPPVVTPNGSEPPETTGSERVADRRAARLKHSYDAGDFYYYRGERMPLRRSLTEFSVEFRQGTSEQRKQDIIDSAFIDAMMPDLNVSSSFLISSPMKKLLSTTILPLALPGTGVTYTSPAGSQT